jgi:LuxR family maltose regulon positive regulatory protein
VAKWQCGVEQEHIVLQELHYYSDRLLGKLDELCFTPAAVVQAPPGYGKTTAVRDFLRTKMIQGATVHWLVAMAEAPASAYWRLCREIGKIDRRAGERLLNVRLPNAANIGETCDVLRSIECARESDQAGQFPGRRALRLRCGPSYGCCMPRWRGRWQEGRRLP